MFNRLARATAATIHSCGHPGVVRAQNKKEAESYAQRIAGTTPCPDCGRQDVQRRRHEEGEAAQADARAAAPPPLAKRPPVIDTPTGVAIAPELLDDEVA